MVTAELAVGALAVVMLTILLAWCVHLATRQLVLEDAVAEVARQTARGDHAGVSAVRADAPPGTTFSVKHEGQAIVVRAQQGGPAPGRLPTVMLTAEAKVLVEPGVRPWPPG